MTSTGPSPPPAKRLVEAAVLLPCHSIEDFPVYPTGDDAQGLLAGWTALWHPSLIAATGTAPTWSRVDTPPHEVRDRLFVIPSVSQAELASTFAKNAREEGACLIRNKKDRDEIVAAALAHLEITPQLDPELTADFHALGFCYLQTLLLTRQMRYSSNLNESLFQSQLVAAARALVAGETDEARANLTACFDLLSQERNHYYSVDVYLLELTLVAATTLGATLRQELGRAGIPNNVIIPADQLARMADLEPSSLAALKEALARGDLGLVGGHFIESQTPLLPAESLLADLRRARDEYTRHLERPPTVYGRWRFGLGPTLPQVLQKLGFRGAVHATFEDGKNPTGSQAKVRWEGSDGTALDAIVRSPLDASRPETFLTWAQTVGRAMDSDHVATISLAHWPGRASPWLQDLRRISRYGSLLGRFVTVDDYFQSTSFPSHLDRFRAEQYQSPYLTQAVIRRLDDPVSSVARPWRKRVAMACASALATLAEVVQGRRWEGRDERWDEEGEGPEGCESGDGDAAWEMPQPGEKPKATGSDTERSDTERGDQEAAAARSRATAALADALPKRAGAAERGCLVLNPLGFTRRVLVDVGSLTQPPDVGGAVIAAGAVGTTTQAVVEVPSMGFVWLKSGQPPMPKRKPPLLLTETSEEGLKLHNDFCSAIISPTTGSLVSLHDIGDRGNRLSQQLALRMPGPPGKQGDTWLDPDESAVYTVMAADRAEITIASTVLGQITARGRLLDRDGRCQARFVQTYRLWRGSRVLELEIELHPETTPAADPWNSYYACRFAWSDENSELAGSLHSTRHATESKRLEAPEFIEIQHEPKRSMFRLPGRRQPEPWRTTILTGGLPYHRRVGLRMLDTLLVPRGERAERFRVGIGIDVPNPAQEALAFLTPTTSVPDSPPPTADAGWLFHLDARSVVATAWTPLASDDKIKGVRFRILETMGRPARVTFSAFRPLVSARRVDFRGESLGDLAIEDGAARLEMTAHEWAEIEAHW